MLEMHSFTPKLSCPRCNAPVLNLDQESFINYLSGTVSSCSECEKDLNFFELVNMRIDENFFYNDVYTFVGAKKALFKMILEVKPSTTLKFEDYGIPRGSRILHINYTPQGPNLFPLEFHGNSPYRGVPKDEVILFPARFEGNPSLPTTLNVMITWIDGESLESVSFKSLVDSLEEYSGNDLIASIVPANTSIEFDVMRYTEDALLEVSSKSNVKEFFKSGVSYVPTLKVLIPLIATVKNFPPMPSEILTSLVQLATLRNQIAHTGKTKAPLTKEQVATLLTAVILAKMYIEAIRNA